MSADREINSGDAIVSLPRTAALVVTPKMKNPFPDEINDAYWSQSQWSVKNCLMYRAQKVHQASMASVIAPARFVQDYPQN